MSGFLASVRSAEEALLALEGGADIIDVKEPSLGALGRVDGAVLTDIVRALRGSRKVSATIGDVPLAPDPVRAAVAATAATGVDIVKIGLFPGDLAATLAALEPLARAGTRLVAVIFADRAPDLAHLIPHCRAAKFFGVMLDTADKQAGPLTTHLPVAGLGRFVVTAREHGLISGLAGALRLADIPALATLGADYLGFRSALTVGGRHRDIDLGAVQAVRRALDASVPQGAGHVQPAASSRATETAGATSAGATASGAPADRTVSSKLR
jgi:(5-formylfuran-3-yl)methyl phosphate synthase